jgi:hypothetical protein
MTVSDLLEQPCYKSDNIIKLVTRCLNNLQYCYIMTVSDLLEQPCYKSDNINKLVTSCINNLYNIVISWLYQTCWNNLATSLIIFVTSCLNNLYNIVISWLYQTCWNNLATSLIISTSLLQAVSTTCTILLYHDCIGLVGSTLLQVW